jgi:hypothetical protein
MRAPLLVALVVTALPLTACGGGSDAKPKVAATAPADIPGATAEVKANWAQFFGPKATLTQKSELVEDSARLQEALAIGAKSPSSTQTTATVTSVTFTSPSKADVVYDLSILGNKVLTGAQGNAVLENGHWKVSKFTFCQLLKLGANGKPVPGCT